jgi:hypothetical protein
MPLWLSALPWRFLSGLACGAFVVWLWHDASVSRIATERVEEKLESAFSVIAANKADESIAKAWEVRLSELRSNENTIIREREKIVEMPVYRNICLEPSGVQLANDAKSGRITSKPVDALQDSK